MLDQGQYNDYPTTSRFWSSNTTNGTYTTAVTTPGAAADEQMRSVVERVIWSILLIIIILASVIGNLLVLVCVHLHHQLREENSSIFIINLSVADMVSAVVVMVSSLHALASDKWLMGPAWCDIVCGTNYTLLIVSIFTLCFVSLDRYIAVKHALHYHARVTRTKIYLLLGFSWCLGFCFGLVPILYRWIRFDYWEAVCAIMWHEDRNRVLLFVCIGFTLCFGLPSMVLIAAYCKVMKIAVAHNKVHQQNADIQASAAKRKDIVTTRFVLPITADEHSRSQHTRETNVQHNTNTVILNDVLNRTACLPPVSSENEGSQRNIIYQQQTGNCLKTEHDSSAVQFEEHLVMIASHSNGDLSCEIAVDHHLHSSSNWLNVTTSMQPVEDGHKQNFFQPTNHHKSPASQADGNPVMQTTYNQSEQFQRTGNSNENVDSSGQLHLANQTGGFSRRRVNNIGSHMSDSEKNCEGVESLSYNSTTNLSLSSCSQPARHNEVCKNTIETSLSTNLYGNFTTQQQTQSLHNQSQSNTQQTTQSLDNPKQTTVGQMKHLVDNQRQLTDDRSAAGNTPSINVPREPDRQRIQFIQNNNENVTNTRRSLSAPSNNTNNSRANKRNYGTSNKAVKSLLLVVIAYFISMTPFCVTKLCKVVFTTDVLPDYINLVSSIFQFFGSAINPLIYGIFRKDFQRAFRLLARRFLGKFGATNVHTSDAQSTVY